MAELTEVITAADFHPWHCNIMMYSTSRGAIKLGDMRQAALCDAYSQGIAVIASSVRGAAAFADVLGCCCCCCASAFVSV